MTSHDYKITTYKLAKCRKVEYLLLIEARGFNNKKGENKCHTEFRLQLSM